MKSILFSIFCLFSSAVLALENVQQTNVKLKQVGAHTGNIFYVELENGFSKPCKWGLAYCVQENEASCKSMLSVALTAKARNAVVSDFRYEYNESTQFCSIWLVAISE